MVSDSMGEVVKKFGVDFHSDGGALTLRPSHVTESHDSGWKISGEIHEDYYAWVNEFIAYHPVYGTIRGDFEKTVTAESEEAFSHFWTHHEPEAWDYMDI